MKEKMNRLKDVRRLLIEQDWHDGEVMKSMEWAYRHIGSCEPEKIAPYYLYRLVCSGDESFCLTPQSTMKLVEAMVLALPSRLRPAVPTIAEDMFRKRLRECSDYIQKYHWSKNFADIFCGLLAHVDTRDSDTTIERSRQTQYFESLGSLIVQAFRERLFQYAAVSDYTSSQLSTATKRLVSTSFEMSKRPFVERAIDAVVIVSNDGDAARALEDMCLESQLCKQLVMKTLPYLTRSSLTTMFTGSSKQYKLAA
jgi:hypothetical protein